MIMEALPDTSGPSLVQTWDDTPAPELTYWWHSLLARYGLHENEDRIGADEFGELVVSAFRMLRDRSASEEFLRNMRTVNGGTMRLRCRYSEFEFVSRAPLGKSYRCRSRLSGEERVCRQIRKDRVDAPSDHVRSELELLRSVDHPHFPRIIESFEDFNSVYVIEECAE